MELSIITPLSTKYYQDIEQVSLPGMAGAFTVLAGHAPLISVLSNGQATYHSAHDTGTFPVSNGIVKIQRDVIQIITD